MDRIDLAEPDIVILAGFMRIFTAEFVDHYSNRLVNIHPSLLPKYTGLNTHQRALDAGDSVAGCSVHFVTEQLDGGPVIMQAQVPIGASDNADTLARRVLSAEHLILLQAVRWCASGRARLEGDHACFDGKPLPPQGVCSTASN